MRRIILAVLTVSMACAGTPPTPGAQPERETHVVVPGTGSFNMVAASGVSSHQYAMTVDQVWKVLPAVLDSIAVPVDVLEPQQHLIGNRGFHLRGKLGKVPLGRYIDCGTTQIGPNAESYDITLTLTLSVAQTSGNAAAMSVDLEASAKPLAFAQEPFRCSTKGNLERRVFDLTAALVSR